MREKLCKTFKYISGYVWDLLRDSQYYGFYQTSLTNINRGLGLKEETISDLILLKVIQRQPYDIISIKFGKNYEAQEGADWEWWFLSRSGIIGLRLQAKRIHINRGIIEYSHLDYQKQGNYQVDILLQQAQSKGMIPLYIFYNWWDLNFPFRDYVNSIIPFCCKVYSSRNLEVTIASAIEVGKAVHSSKKSLSDILPISYPISCLFCCQYSDLTKSLHVFLNRYITKQEIDIKIYETLPKDVYMRLKGEFDEKSPIYTVFILDLEEPYKDLDKIKEVMK